MLDMKELLAFAVEQNASDVHLACGIPPKLRINGKLTEVEVPPLSPADAAEAIGSIMHERHKAILKERGEVDFSFAAAETGRFRVNVFMDRGNMAAAYRKVDTQIPRPDMLGIPDSVVQLYKKKRGLVLVTGPTGSGKSTTLYMMLAELSERPVNISTIEDPVEKNLPKLNQMQVHPVAGLTFEVGLRALLRQDPDIIMVGETRDTETASISIRAAITGHLVLSTLHTNDAASSVIRLVDMGIEPYMVADSVVGIIAQRLVRRLCPKCKVKKEMTDTDKLRLRLRGDSNPTIYAPGPEGCVYCNNSGYRGRIGVYEIMPITPTLRDCISRGVGAEEIQKVALKEGLTTLRVGAAKLVLKGITSITEVERVAAE